MRMHKNQPMEILEQRAADNWTYFPKKTQRERLRETEHVILFTEKNYVFTLAYSQREKGLRWMDKKEKKSQDINTTRGNQNKYHYGYFKSFASFHNLQNYNEYANDEIINVIYHAPTYVYKFQYKHNCRHFRWYWKVDVPYLPVYLFLENYMISNSLCLLNIS